jgi:hypothetical protein
MNPIDHLVLPVTTLTLARARLASLGFTVTPDARHPFGTGNCLALFEDRSFLEAITIQDRHAADVAAAEGNTFVKRLKRFTERNGEGFAMLALAADDAEEARQGFDSAGFGSEAILRFSRLATLPDGSEREIGFRLAFAADSNAPDATVFACQHLAREVLFQPDYLRHANSATGIAGVIAAAQEPERFEGLFEAAMKRGSGAAGEEATADDCRVSLLTPTEFRERYGIEAPDPRRGFVFAGVEIGVVDIDLAAACTGSGDRRDDGSIVIPPAPGLGALLVFQESRNG